MLGIVLSLVLAAGVFASVAYIAVEAGSDLISLLPEAPAVVKVFGITGLVTFAFCMVYVITVIIHENTKPRGINKI